MSNKLVGVVYDRVIQEVCDSSQIDFFEGGVDQQTLEDLRKGWQKKLSGLEVAHFPWDPAPQPPPPPPQQAPIPPPPVTVPSNAPRASPSPPQKFSEQKPQPHAGNALGPTDVRVKSESNLPPNPSTAANTAQQRAAEALQQRYGAAAASQIQQLQTQSQAALSLPGQPRFHPGQQPQNPDLKLSQQQSHPQSQSVSNGQTDGAGDFGNDALTEWKAEVARRRAAAQENGAEANRMMREYVELRGLQMEGNGLLAPLRSRYPGATGKKRKSALKKSAAFSGLVAVPEDSASHQGGYDGVDDYGVKKDEDEDAINSDLDDSDDPAEDLEGDESHGEVMLCTYDKVQRVKSKWKCTLKDGTLTTGRREYVFHKGTGEFEWY